jgi:hypothetical protein
VEVEEEEVEVEVEVEVEEEEVEVEVEEEEVDGEKVAFKKKKNDLKKIAFYAHTPASRALCGRRCHPLIQTRNRPPKL